MKVWSCWIPKLGSFHVEAETRAEAAEQILVAAGINLTSCCDDAESVRESCTRCGAESRAYYPLREEA